MDFNVRIGFCAAYGKGYCTKCKKVFNYCYNYCNGMKKGEGNCPHCGAGEKWEDVVRSDFIEMQIMMHRGLIHSNHEFMNDEKRKNLRKEVNELLRIQRLFIEDEERRNETN